MNPLPIPPEPAPSRRARLAAGLAVALLFAFPLVFAAAAGFESFTMSNESIAYRWGHASRALAGDVPPILPQGFTVSAIQQQLVRAIEQFVPASAATLRASMQYFSWGTLAVFAVLFAALLAAALRNPRIDASRLALVFLPWVAAVYATGAVGFYYALLPDYYHLNALLACATPLLLLPFVMAALDPAQPRPTLRQVAVLGIVLGGAVANKVTWGVPCIFAFVLSLLPGPFQLRFLLVRSTVLVGSAVLALLLVLCVYYSFSPGAMATGSRQWLEFMKNQAGEMAFGSPDFYRLVRGYNYDWLYPLEFLTALFALAVVRGWRARAVVLAALGGIAVLAWSVSQRPAGTTLWDINVLTLSLTAAAALAIERPWARRGVVGFWCLAICLLIARNPLTGRLNAIRAAAPAAENRFQVYAEINRFAEGRPQLVIFLNNEYHHEGVHELLLKVASDFPSWDVGAGQAWLDRYNPSIRFLHEYGPPVTLPADLSGFCVVWFDRPDLPLLTSKFPELDRLVRDPGYEHVSFPVFVARLADSPGAQSWVRAVRRRGAEPFRSTAASLDSPIALPDPDAPAESAGPRIALTGMRTQPGVVQLDWPPATEGQYEIQIAAGPTDFTSIGRGDARSGRYVVGSLQPGDTYRFRARHWVNDRSGPWSPVVSVAPLP